MGVATGCGFKEIYRFPHTTYPYSSCICTFCSSIPTFLFIFKNVFRSLYNYIHAVVCNIHIVVYIIQLWCLLKCTKSILLTQIAPPIHNYLLFLKILLHGFCACISFCSCVMCIKCNNYFEFKKLECILKMPCYCTQDGWDGTLTFLY